MVGTTDHNHDPGVGAAAVMPYFLELCGIGPQWIPSLGCESGEVVGRGYFDRSFRMSWTVES